MSETKKILLICGAGASSGFLAQSMRKAAKKKGIEVSIEARSESELQEYIERIDTLLIGPHLKYMESELREKVKSYGIQVAVIDQLIYGTLDGEKALDLALNLN